MPKAVTVQPNENSDADESSSGEDRPLIPSHKLSLVDPGKTNGEKHFSIKLLIVSKCIKITIAVFGEL